MMKFPAWIWAAGMVLSGPGWPVFGQTRLDLRTQSKSVDLSAQPTKTSQTGAALPATCQVGETYFLTAAPAGNNYHLCVANNTWSKQPPVAAGDRDQILSNNGSVTEWRAAGGDITGPVGSLQVSGIQGRSVSAAPPEDGNTLRWRAATDKWEAGVPLDAGPGINVSATLVSVDDAVTPIYYTGVAPPSLPCAPGRDYYVDTGAAELYYCGGANAWSKAAKTAQTTAALTRTFGVSIDGGGVAVAPGIAGYVTIPYSCGISGWSIQADQPGSIAVELDKHAGAIPNTTTDKITASAPLALSGAQLAQSTTLSGWSAQVNTNDVVGFNVISATTLTRATIIVNCQ